MRLIYKRRVRKHIDHLTNGVLYVHHFESGWQELVFADHAAAARFAAGSGAAFSGPAAQQDRDEGAA